LKGGWFANKERKMPPAAKKRGAVKEEYPKHEEILFLQGKHQRKEKKWAEL